MRTCFLICLIFPFAAAAQSPVSAERPSFSSSPLALDAGRWQAEGGFVYSRFNGNVDGYTLPQLLLRYGASERAEIQVSWGGYSDIDAGGSSIDGITDASIGVKWQLSDDNARTPIGLFAGLSLPIGSSEFTSDQMDPAIGLFWAHNGRLSLFGTVLVSESDDDTSVGNAIGIGLPTGNACGSCSAYIEYVGIHPEGQGPQHSLNGGISWLRSNDLVLDVNLGLGINDRAGDGYVGFGAAYRF